MLQTGSVNKDGIPTTETGNESGAELSGPSTSSSQRLVYNGEGDVVPLYEGREALLYFDWIFRFWIYFDTPAHGVSYYSAFGFFIGGMCFIVGTFSALSPAVQALSVPGSCGTDGYTWWTYFPYLLGDCIWLTACGAQILEAINLDYDDRIEAWNANKQQGPKPRYRLFGLRLGAWDWWGAVFYEVGVMLYTVAQCFSYAALCPNVHISPLAYTWLINYFYIIAGILFLLAGLFYTIVLGSPYVLPSILLPFNKGSWGSMMWWIVWLYWWGGVCFFTSGVFLYWYSPTNMKLSLLTYQIESSIGFGGGAFLFMVGAMMLLMRQARGRCRPSYAELTTNCDLSVHGGGSYMTMKNRGESVV